jgi:hypothetical protein
MINVDVVVEISEANSDKLRIELVNIISDMPKFDTFRIGSYTLERASAIFQSQNVLSKEMLRYVATLELLNIGEVDIRNIRNLFRNEPVIGTRISSSLGIDVIVSLMSINENLYLTVEPSSSPVIVPSHRRSINKLRLTKFVTFAIILSATIICCLCVGLLIRKLHRVFERNSNNERRTVNKVTW